METNMKERTYRILVVDDEEDFRGNLLRMLKAEDLEAEAAESGARALEMLAEKEYDVVLLDLRMPEMNGEEVLRCMRAAGATAEVIVLTGHVSLDSAIDLIREGAFDYQLKPYVQSKLLENIKMACEKRRLHLGCAEKPETKLRGGIFRLFFWDAGTGKKE